MFNGMEILFNSKQATPLLVDTVALYVQIKDLEHEVASENERLLVSTPSDVWHTPTFYFVTGDMKLSILLHIPVGRVDSHSTVYQYVPTSIALPNSSVHFLIDPMDDFLADPTYWLLNANLVFWPYVQEICWKWPLFALFQR